jgi:hypothetical protein
VRPEAARADRNAAVRGAARAWKRAGAIDDATLAAIEAAVPDDRVRVGPVLRALLFLFTALTANAGFWFVMLLFPALTPEGPVFAVLCLGFAVALAFLTEVLTGPLKRAQFGIEAATSFMALAYAIAGFGWFLFEGMDLPEKAAISTLCASAAVLFAAASWRWGYPLYAAAAVAALLGSLLFVPGARLFWIVLPLLAAPALFRLSRAERFVPSHRAGGMAALVAALTGLYVAVHLGSFDTGLIENFWSWRGSAPGFPALRWLSILATALVPVAVLAWGVRARRRPLLLLGLAGLAASIVTFHDVLDLGPLWVVLMFWGTASVAAALALRRYLDSGEERERGGFTAEPLFEDLGAEGWLEAGAAVVTLAPDARDVRADPGFAGGGGEFGGGGSSSSF